MNDRLISRCEEFVVFKDSLDRFIQVKDVVGGPFVRCAAKLEGINKYSSTGQRPAILPSAFISLALPFANVAIGSCPTAPREIECSLVIGGTKHSKWIGIKPDEFMDSSDTLGKSSVENVQQPYYAQIGRLPLYVAIEGKNRVELFKAFRNMMDVQVTDTFYPEPEALTIHKIRPWGLYGLRYQDELKYLPFAHVVLPLLREYGVRDGVPIFDPFAIFSVRSTRKQITSALMI